MHGLVYPLHGYPLPPHIKYLVNTGQKLKASHFDVFWTFERPPREYNEPHFLRSPQRPAEPRYQDPHVVRTRGRPWRDNNNTTRRDLLRRGRQDQVAALSYLPAELQPLQR